MEFTPEHLTFYQNISVCFFLFKVRGETTESERESPLTHCALFWYRRSRRTWTDRLLRKHKPTVCAAVKVDTFKNTIITLLGKVYDTSNMNSWWSCLYRRQQKASVTLSLPKHRWRQVGVILFPFLSSSWGDYSRLTLNWRLEVGLKKHFSKLKYN